MKKNFSTLVNKDTITSIAIGGFDGMHSAHQELFKQLDSNGAILSIESKYATLTKTRKDLSIVYNLFLPKTEDLITIQDAKSGLKLIKKISDSHSSFSNVYPTFFIFKKDYNIPIPKPN